MFPDIVKDNFEKVVKQTKTNWWITEKEDVGLTELSTALNATVYSLEWFKHKGILEALHKPEHGIDPNEIKKTIESVIYLVIDLNNIYQTKLGLLSPKDRNDLFFKYIKKDKNLKDMFPTIFRQNYKAGISRLLMILNHALGINADQVKYGVTMGSMYEFEFNGVKYHGFISADNKRIKRPSFSMWIKEEPFAFLGIGGVRIMSVLNCTGIGKAGPEDKTILHYYECELHDNEIIELIQKRTT